MLSNTFQYIKRMILKNYLAALIISKIYVLYNNIKRRKKIKIWKNKDYWIHSTSVGLIPHEYPLFNPEKYTTLLYEIFFSYYTPKKDDVVLELGSGSGNETLYISKLIGDNGRIYAVEPFDVIFKFLKETIEINNLKNVKLIKKALFNENTSIGFASRKNRWLGGRINFNSANKTETMTLNNFVIENNIKKINYCKINIEGAEKYITENSDEFFKICNNLAIECHDFLQEVDLQTYDMLKNFLIEKKYTIKKCKRIVHPSDEFFIFASK